MYDPFIDQCSEFGAVLREDHASLFEALEDLLFDETSTPEYLRSVWHRFEATLHYHLTLEEEVLIPRFELVHAADAARIRGEHRQMREQLVVLADQFERGTVDREGVARLLGILRVSAALKEQGLYVWAEEALRPRDKARVVESVRAHQSVPNASVASSA
jgi:hypothetical protein